VWGYRENDPMGGKDPYSASKGCAELITNAYKHSFFTNEKACHIASARAGNVIGGGDWAENRIVPDYFRALKAKQDLVIRNLYATRPWQHVLEPLSGYLCLAATLLTQGKVYTGGWNFGPDDTSNYSVKQLIDEMLKITPSINYASPDIDQKPHEANLLKLDISKAVNRLKWMPVLTFAEAVEFTVAGYMADLKNNDEILGTRIEQINIYVSKARQLQINWAN